MHLALCTWIYALGSVHSALCTRLCALDSMHLALFALGSMHLALCTWLYALGSMHLAQCTWLYVLDSAQVTLRKLVRELRAEEPFGKKKSSSDRFPLNPTGKNENIPNQMEVSLQQPLHLRLARLHTGKMHRLKDLHSLLPPVPCRRFLHPPPRGSRESVSFFPPKKKENQGIPLSGVHMGMCQIR